MEPNPAFYRLFQFTESATDRRLIYELGNCQWDIPELRLMLTDIVTSGAQFQGFELTYSLPMPLTSSMVSLKASAP